MERYKAFEWLNKDGWNVDLNDQFAGTEFTELSFNDIADLMNKYRNENNMYLKEQLSELKVILKFYHGELKRKVMIDEIINNIETIINK